MTSIITPRRLLTAAVLSLTLAGCGGDLDPTGPSVAGPGFRRASSRTTDGSTTGTETTKTVTDETTLVAGSNRLRFASWAPPLTTYDTTFTLVQGKASADTLFFVKRSFDLVPVPFMILTTPRDGQFVDAQGTALPKGAAVQLTVHVDRTYVELQFGPHGSTFTKSPAKLKLFWMFTDLGSHLGSDLKVWYQPVAGTAWTPLATTVNLEDFWLTSDIDHFSNYHIAY
ncbi:MAG: hypothetical protein ACKVZ0_15620 [Gemmatimonadales bacterium]